VLPTRLARLPARPLPRGLTLLYARGLRARLTGLAGLGALPPGHALAIPRCSSVHTFGMRFSLDLLFLAEDGSLVRAERHVPPNRVHACRGAACVVEARAGEGPAFAAALRLAPAGGGAAA